jgi:hypothetical protein
MAIKKKTGDFITESPILEMPEAGIEPAQYQVPRDFKSLVSTNSTTSAKKILRRRADSNRRIKVLQTSPLATWVRRQYIYILYSSKTKKSERRGSNPRHQPWQGCALPAELLSLLL